MNNKEAIQLIADRAEEISKNLDIIKQAKTRYNKGETQEQIQSWIIGVAIGTLVGKE